MNANIKIIEQIGGHAAMGFAIRAQADLLNQRMADETSRCADWDSKAVLAIEPGTENIIGIITFSELKWNKEIAVGTGYVLPAWREKGVYREMWAALVCAAQEAKCSTICGITKTGNHRMRAVAERLGREEESINLRFAVPEAAKP